MFQTNFWTSQVTHRSPVSNANEKTHCARFILPGYRIAYKLPELYLIVEIANVAIIFT